MVSTHGPDPPSSVTDTYLSPSRGRHVPSARCKRNPPDPLPVSAAQVS